MKTITKSILNSGPGWMMAKQNQLEFLKKKYTLNKSVFQLLRIKKVTIIAMLIASEKWWMNFGLWYF